MKKLIIAACLALAAVVVAPVASASAETFTGACVIEGEATFYKAGGETTEEGLPRTGQRKMSYKFVSKPRTECVGVVGGTPVSGPAKATVKGEGELGCQQSSGTGGSGEIEDLTTTKKASFTTFDFTGVGTEVSFTVGLGAAGHASFAGDREGVEECAGLKGAEGPKKLKFKAVAFGTLG